MSHEPVKEIDNWSCINRTLTINYNSKYGQVYMLRKCNPYKCKHFDFDKDQMDRMPN